MKRLLALSMIGVLLTGCTTAPPVTETTTLPVITTTTTVTTTTTTTTTTEPTTTTTTHITTAPLQTVGGSLTVSTTLPPESDGFAWSDEQIAAVDALIASYEGAVSVGYYDITSGYGYQYHAEQVYPAASVIKAPFCRYVLGMAEEYELDLSDVMTYTADVKVGGTGSIQNAEFGTEYTQEQLIRLAIRKSDNIAFKLLRQKYPAAGYRRYAEAIGITDIKGIKNISASTLNAADAVTYMRDIYAYITGGTAYGAVLEEHMKNTINPMIRSAYPIVRKYGWMDGAYHDAAIIQAPRPYILVILSDHSEGTKDDRTMFAAISERIEAIHVSLSPEE